MTLAVIAHPTRMVPPSEMALILGEEEFEDYLDKYLAIEQKNWINATSSPRSGCTLRVNGDFGQPQPVYINRRTNNYLAASGNSGQIRLGGGEEVIVSCPNNQAIRHPNIVSTVHTATARCVSNNLFSGAGWLNGNRAFGQLTCAGHAFYQAQQTSTRCFNNGVVIRVGFSVNNRFYPLYQSCYNQNRMEVLYVWYNQNANNAVHQNGVGRPSWL
ncbi:dsRNase, partial [Danaus plexippus plexippus]